MRALLIIFSLVVFAFMVSCEKEYQVEQSVKQSTQNVNPELRNDTSMLNIIVEDTIFKNFIFEEQKVVDSISYSDTARLAELSSTSQENFTETDLAELSEILGFESGQEYMSYIDENYSGRLLYCETQYNLSEL